MSDEVERERLSDPPDRNAVLRRDDPEHLELIRDMREVKDEVSGLKDSAERVEKRLLGEWDDIKREWRPGVLQEMQGIRMSVGKAIKVFAWVGGIFTAVLTAALITLVNLSLENHAHLQTLSH